MLYIFSLILGFIVGCIGMHSAIKEEIQQCKTYEELAKTLTKLCLLKINKNQKHWILETNST